MVCIVHSYLKTVNFVKETTRDKKRVHTHTHKTLEKLCEYEKDIHFEAVNKHAKFQQWVSVFMFPYEEWNGKDNTIKKNKNKKKTK